MDINSITAKQNKTESFNRNPSRISIKEMCLKFENLNDSDKTKAFSGSPDQHKLQEAHTFPSKSPKVFRNDGVTVETVASTRSETPKVPARNRRNVKTDNLKNEDVSASGKVHNLNGNTKSTSYRTKEINTPNDSDATNRVSVRERTKAFEISQHADKSVFAVKQSLDKAVAHEVRDSSREISTDDGIPPSKPFRKKFEKNGFNHPTINAPSSNLDCTVSPNKIKDQTPMMINSSSNFDSTNDSAKTPLRHRCSDSANTGDSYSHGKSSSASKTSALKRYFKNIGTTAQQISEKVKNKSSNIFVDLTPTTVSPPKNYGTLKHSHSEEHIYAEPFESSLDTSNGTSYVKCKENPLHYMCSPVFCNDDGSQPSPKVPLTVHKESRLKNASVVRSIIYASFSLLRRPAVPAEDISTNEGGAGDSESDVSAKDVQNRIIYVKSIKRQMSVSSICISPRLFEAVLIITISDNGPEIIFKHPQVVKKEFDYPLIPHLCFPDYQCLQQSAVYRSEMFHFTLIDGDEIKIFGYCHRILGWPEHTQGFCSKFPAAICILSSISAVPFYKRILIEIEKHLSLPVRSFKEYLSTLRKLGVPNAGASVSIPDNTEKEPGKVVITRPLDSHVVSMSLTRSLQLLDVDVLLKALSSLLLERRVLLLSHNTWNVLHCCEAILSLLYPFQWQHLMIPIVPRCLMIQCCTESPYFLGITCSDYGSILDLLSEHQVLVIDVDKGRILKAFDDENTILPKKVQKAVSGALSMAKNMTDPTEMMRDVMISEAALHMFVEMLGHGESFFVNECESIKFQYDAFQKNAPSKSIQSFLQWFSETQMFEAFVEDCIWRRNYRKICQLQQLTLFEKRVEEYKWELAHDNDKICKKIGKTMKSIGEMLKILTKN